MHLKNELLILGQQNVAFVFGGVQFAFERLYPGQLVSDDLLVVATQDRAGRAVVQRAAVGERIYRIGSGGRLDRVMQAHITCKYGGHSWSVERRVGLVLGLERV